MRKTLIGLCWAMGIACALIGIVHMIGGILTVPGEAGTGATVDSRERFYNAIFAGYGLAWIWAVRQRPLPTTAIRWLTAIFLLGGVGRLLSLAVHGNPHWFQLPLTAIEVVLPVVVFVLARNVDRTGGTERHG